MPKPRHSITAASIPNSSISRPPAIRVLLDYFARRLKYHVFSRRPFETKQGVISYSMSAKSGYSLTDQDDFRRLATPLANRFGLQGHILDVKTIALTHPDNRWVVYITYDGLSGAIRFTYDTF
jgi:hypothetical protein